MDDVDEIECVFDAFDCGGFLMIFHNIIQHVFDAFNRGGFLMVSYNMIRRVFNAFTFIAFNKRLYS